MSSAAAASEQAVSRTERWRAAIIRTALAVFFATYVWMLFMGVHHHVLELRVGQAPKQAVVRIFSLKSPFSIRVPGQEEARRRLGFIYKNVEVTHSTDQPKLPVQPAFHAGWGVMLSRQVVETTAPEAEAEFIASHHTFRLKGRELRSGDRAWQLRDGETVEINVRALPPEIPDPDDKSTRGKPKEPWEAATEPAGEGGGGSERSYKKHPAH